jgi:hypothetical protein
MNRGANDAMKYIYDGICDCSSLGTNVEIYLEKLDTLREALVLFERTSS